MQLERIEKILAFSLIGISAAAILLRVIGVIPGIIVSGEVEISRTIFIDSGIGGLLAVFAIVISLTLMGIQFASQEYTHRVMNTYLKSLILWTMMGAYLVTVLYNLYMVALMKEPVNTLYADVSVILQSFCLVMLIPHFVLSVYHLKPDYTINSLINSINRDYINAIAVYLEKADTRVPHKEDRLLPVVEILEKCIERGDRATVRAGLDELLDWYHKNMTAENESWLGRYYTDYLLRLGRESVIEADDDSIVQVLEILGEIGSSSRVPAVASATVDHIKTIGANALKKEYEAGVEQMVDSLQRVIIATGEKEMVERIFDSYGDVVRQLFVQEKKQLITYFVNSMSGLSGTLITRQDIGSLKKWTGVVEDVGRLAVKQEMRDILHVVIQALYHTGTSAARGSLDTTCNAIIEAMVRIERQISQTDRELFSEINFAKQDIELHLKKHAAPEKTDTGIETSDLW